MSDQFNPLDSFGKVHSGKSFTEVNHDKLTISITMDCDSCGRNTISDFPIQHIPALLHMLHELSEELGLKSIKCDSRLIEQKDVTSLDDLETARHEFEKMPINDPEKPRLTPFEETDSGGSAWD